jgi:hypothetical protein
MRLIGLLLIIIVSFIGLSILIHICAKHNYEIKYSFDKRKIEIRPAKSKGESQPNTR